MQFNFDCPLSATGGCRQWHCIRDVNAQVVKYVWTEATKDLLLTQHVITVGKRAKNMYCMFAIWESQEK